MILSKIHPGWTTSQSFQEVYLKGWKIYAKELTLLLYKSNFPHSWFSEKFIQTGHFPFLQDSSSEEVQYDPDELKQEVKDDPDELKQEVKDYQDELKQENEDDDGNVKEDIVPEANDPDIDPEVETHRHVEGVGYKDYAKYVYQDTENATNGSDDDKNPDDPGELKLENVHVHVHLLQDHLGLPHVNCEDENDENLALKDQPFSSDQLGFQRPASKLHYVVFQWSNQVV